jgi:hypothetical protein
MEWMLLVLFLRVEDNRVQQIEDRQVLVFPSEQACVAAGEALEASSVRTDPKQWSVSTCVSKREFDDPKAIATAQ